ncbi:short-chain dehydrogenase/reductase [Reticulibacter mediterranei]|uniref:Short-chain dehydrogenase/reductase n=1 Tax=Reticulibacter mediterranei TaxID=2778369 RepID=A0A8J3IY71_9CHLR|nr:SDR family oxidoreductase [Reticulibacter mediterranei]GHO98236.1 short-chain dehydrogenase/reductase [Reticulibacter mediterranei]
MATAPQSNRGAVLITGAAGGLGVATVRQLDALGFQVFAGVRKAADGERLQREISSRIIPVLLDVTDSDSITRAAQMVTKALGSAGLAGLVNNAGLIVEGPIELTPIAEIRKEFEVCVLGPVAVTQAFLPLLRKARGRIVNVGALSGLVTLPYYGIISAAKTALESFTDALRGELLPWGISISIVEPGALQTEIFDKSGASAQQTRQQFSAQQQQLYASGLAALSKTIASQHRDNPSIAVAAITHALTSRRPKTRYPVGQIAGALVFLRVLPDRLRDTLLLRSIGIPRAQPTV